MTDTTDKETVSNDEDLLTELRERFKLCVDQDSENREEALDDLKFVWNVNNYQWPQDAKSVREGRPMLTENRLPQFVRQVVNGIRKNRPAISVIPADDKASPVVADIKEGLIRHIEQRSRADLAYDNAAFYAVASSVGYFQITTEYADSDGFDQELAIKPIDNPFTVYDDPFCKMPDKSDRRFCIITEMVNRKEFEREHGFEPTAFDQLAGIGDDRAQWFTDEDVRVAKYWRIVKKKKKIYRFVPPGGEPIVVKPDDEGKYKYEGQEIPKDILKGFEEREIESQVVEPYLCTGDKVIKKSKWLGKYIPIVAVIGEEANIEGKKHRKSLIRDAKDSQKANNYYLSAEAEVVALQPKVPWIGEEGTFDTDSEKWSTANTKNWPFIQFKKGRQAPQRNYPEGFPDGIRNSRMAAIEGMKAVLGMYDASLGARSNETSGVAIENRAKQGDNATFHFPDNMNRAIRYAGLVVIDLMPYYYDASRVIRILSPEGESKLQAINSLFIGKGGNLESIDFAKGSYECVVKAGPSYETLRQEEREHVINLTKAMPQLTQIAPDLIMASMDFHNSDKYAERLKKTVPPEVLGAEEQQENPQDGPAPIPMEVQQAMQQVQEQQQVAQQMMGEAEQAKLEADKAKTAADGAKNSAEAVLTKLDAARRVFDADLRAAKAELACQAQPAAEGVIEPEPQVPDANALALIEANQMFVATIGQLVETLKGPKQRDSQIVENPDGSFSMRQVEQPMMQQQPGA